MLTATLNNPQEPTWLARHAAMDSLVDVLRSSELDPHTLSTLVPPCLLPPGAESPHADVPNF